MILHSHSNFEREEQSRRDHNACYQTILQDHCNKNSLVLAEGQAHRSMEQNAEPGNKPMLIWSVNI